MDQARPLAKSLEALRAGRTSGLPYAQLMPHDRGVTMLILDVATYQGDLRPTDVKRAGFAAVNLKVSHGLSRKSVHPNITGWVDDARKLGLGLATFHWLTADASGADQAEYAYARITELGLQHGTAHTMDVEQTPAPTLAQVRDYLGRMSVLLARPVALYTGDWWWAARKGWNVADLTPYLWAAPNAGYLGGYPGDTSTHWQAGYGGWPNLAVMQYAVQPLTYPDGTRGTIDVSKSAIRTPSVWRDLTTGRPGMSYAPAPLLAARRLYIDTLKLAGFTINPLAVGIVGDDAHANSGTSYHLGKDALRTDSYSIIESPRDRAGLSNAAMALDLGWFHITVAGKRHDLRTFSIWLVAQCKAAAAGTADIREVIYSADGTTVKRWDRLNRRTTGDSSHRTHTHISYFRDTETRDKTALLRRYFTEIGVLKDDRIGDEMSEQVVTAALEKFFARAAQPDGTPTSRAGRDVLDQGIPNPFRTGSTRTTMWALMGDMAVALKAIRDDDPIDEQAIASSVLQGIAARAQDAAATISDLIVASLPAEIAEQVVDKMAERLGSDSTRATGRAGVDLTGGAPEGDVEDAPR